MLRDLLAKDQSHSEKSDKQENRKPAADGLNASPPDQHKEDEEFVPVSHDDVRDADDDDEESEMERVLRPFMGLQRQLMQRDRGGPPNKFDDLHPYTQILSLSNVDDCVELEEAAFPEHERASREKVSHFLSTSALGVLPWILALFSYQYRRPEAVMGHMSR